MAAGERQKRDLVGVEVGERPVGRLVRRLVVQHVVPVAERAALHVLTAEAHVDSFLRTPKTRLKTVFHLRG